MLLEYERQAVIDYCNRMEDTGLTIGTAGNISIFNREKGLFAISPTSTPYKEITLKDVPIVDLDGKVVEGNKEPSCECSLHRHFYVCRNDIHAVVHCHAPYATAVSTLEKPIPMIHFDVMYSHKYEIPCSEFGGMPGSPELAKAVEKAIGEDGYAALMAHHGMIALGRDIAMAWEIANEIECCAQYLVRASAVGKPVVITKEMTGDFWF